MSSNPQYKAAPSVERLFFRAAAADLRKVPGSPIAYWLSPQMVNSFHSHTPLSAMCEIREGINTGDNDQFLRRWTEIAWGRFSKPNNLDKKHNFKWFAHRKGGEFRKWYGNQDYVINWEHDGLDIHNFHDLPQDYNGAPVRGKAFFFLPGLTWSRISSGSFALRYYEAGMTYDSTAPSIFSNPIDSSYLLGFLNSRVVFHLLAALSPTLDFRITSMGRLPIVEKALLSRGANERIPSEKLIEISRLDWNSYEISWNFNSPSLLQPDNRQRTLQATYLSHRTCWHEMTLETQRLEEENNRIFIEAYGLEDELTPEVPLNEITLICNPHYRYRGDKSDDELEELLLADTMRELISYAVGCMFGRYSLDKPGLVLANQGETLADYLTQVPEPSFTPDEDNVIPILDGEWFADDITERFRQFLRVTFGEEHYDENLRFIEKAIGKDIRRFFLRDFYNDHVKRYKKRPIYWLFSSPQGTFNALIYMHRYQPHTVGTVLSYLRDFRKKLDAHLQHLRKVSISTDVSQGDKTRALKDIDKLRKQILELDDYERDTLYPLATQQIAIDLDDGVKANYPKFGAALKRIVGLEAKDDD